ncbi:amino acid adenylation domain-containing protein [Streptomyces sp. HP-A2021]|uniref:non-ribosomal peptide synthetase n=1 Tax=Streptomyces sp. HP-A2021 TaxID=2927875 RepID=UPI001FAEF3D9|nr:non-ribosomal peptide synthetase [Streptomyces sp. HP-A2021]UOB08255.1 amino acid adenylation domain-containing protein [Streptomyces sp. HP-A2021]
MSNVIALQQALRAHPGQAAYWRAQRHAWTEPTVLVRDHLRRHPEAGPQVQAAIPPAAVAAAGKLTGGDPMLQRVLAGAVLALLAARATDRRDVTVFVPVADTAVPLSVPVAADQTGRGLLTELRARYLEAAEHLDIPVQALLRHEEQQPSDMMLTLDSQLTPDHAEQAGCPVLFDVRTDTVAVHADPRLFSSGTAQRLADTYAELYAVLLADPAAPLAAQLAADEAEIAAITGEFNDTAAPFPDTRTLHSFLEERSSGDPSAIAVADDGTTYGELNAAANRLARVLRSRGVQAGTVVGVCVPRSKNMLVAIYAILKAGGAYLPVDPTLPRNRVDYILDHSGTALVVTTDETREVVTGRGTVEVTAAYDDTVDPDDLEPLSGPDDLAYVIYTSGSTGRPKGVMVEHRAIVNRLWWMQRAYPLGGDDVILHKTPFTFDVSVWEIFWWSLAGASVVTLPGGEEKNPERIVERIATAGVTTLHFVPPMLNAFLQYVSATDTEGRLGSVRRVFASGEALAVAHAELFQKVIGAHARLVNLYGPTEAAVDVTHQPCDTVDSTRSIPIGRPIDNIRLYVLTRDGAHAPLGTPGELCIAGVGLARGYLNAPELTEERFPLHPFEPTGRIYRTGDLARRLSDGTIEYLGRIDTQVKIRGYRIELGEIEHVAGLCPGVTSCAVTAVEDTSGEKSLAAYVVAAAGFDTDALRRHLAAELPSYMVPQHIVEIDAIPTNHNGKRDLKSLPRPAATGTGSDAAAPVVAPRTSTEQALAAIWSEVLGLETVGVHDNFFALGGDSIKFIGVLARARAAGLRFSFQDLFAHPTVGELAGVAETGEAAGAGSEAPAPVEPFALLSPADRAALPPGSVDAYPMSQLQIGLIYEAARSDVEGLYHDILSYPIGESVDVGLFERAVAHVAGRHAVFRTSFHLRGFSEPIQVVHAEVPSPLTVHDLRALSAAERQAALEDFSRQELRAGFGDGTPDLVRVHLHLLGPEEFQYSLSYHDAALDGWSVNTIHRDLFTAYFALLDGREPEAPTYDVSYRDFISLERQALDSGEQRAFWLDLMTDAQSTQLPRHRAQTPPGEDLPEVVIHDVGLPEGLSARLIERAHQLRLPVKSLLLAAHTAVLGFVAGTNDVLTGYEHSGRPETEGGETVPGLFLNTVPFRLRLPDDGTWADLARAAYEAESAMLPHRRFPMAEIKRAVGSRDMLFETVFNFTHFHVLKSLGERDGFALVRSVVNAQTEFPFRAEFSQDAVSDEVLLSIHYHPDVLDAAQTARMASYYTQALTLLANEPDQPLGATSLMSAEEQALLREFGGGPRMELPDGTFVDAFAASVRRNPDAVAVRHGERGLTYAQLDEESDRFCAFLAGRGVRAGDVVTTMLPRGTAWAVTVLALLKSGAVYLPQERAYPADRVASVLRRSGCRHVVAADQDVARLQSALDARLDGVEVLAYEQAASVAPAAPAGRPGPDDVAYIIFTSGSTGEPKGAMIRHSGMLNHLLAKELDLKLAESDRVAQIATQCFDISVWQLLVAWMCGGSTVIYGQDEIVEAGTFLAALREDGITVLEVVPSYLDALLTEVEQRPVGLPDLRFNMVTGEPLPPALTRRWFAQYDVPLVNAYGPTEASDDVTHHVIEHPVLDTRTPVGRPVVNTGIHVVGFDDTPRPIGGYGEICVTGAGVGLGYVNDEERTAAVFVANTLDDRSQVMYRTGDVGRWLPDGSLDCAGRVDHQVKVRGHRIELSEIDSALERLPGVDGAVTLARELRGEKRLVAFYCGTAEPDLPTFHAGLSASLPAYMHPEILVRMTEFPLTGNGKVDRKALARHELAAVGRTDVVPPADEDERLVRDLFAEVLGHAPETVGVTDNFFEIGGHSLAAMKVAAASEGRISLRDLLAHPTARHLARGLVRQAGTRRDLLVDLTAAAGGAGARPRATVVCVPFAGGSAVSYVALARELAQADAPIRVLGVELPGRTRDDSAAPVPVEQLAEQLAEEIQRSAGTPVLLLGHCAGSALGLATVPRLRERQVDVRGLFVVAKLLKSVDPSAHASNEVVDMSEEEILAWLVDNTGLQDIAGLGAKERTDLARAFQYDTAQATRAFHQALSTLPASRLDCPLTVLLAEDDPLAQGHQETARNWELFSDAVRVEVGADGGHYLNATRPERIAAALRAGLGV